MTKSFPFDSDRNSGILVRDGRARAERDIYIESFGVKMCFSASGQEALETIIEILPQALPGCFRFIDKTNVAHRFELILEASESGSGNRLFQNGKEIPSNHSRADVLGGLRSQIRLTVAEHAAGKVFVHAGVVGWKGFALVIPGRSLSGKTTLTAALVERGAEYFSDEFAVFDEEGFAHPFLKTLSVRGEIDEFTQKEYPVEAFGGRSARGKIPVGLILLAEYKPGARWLPQQLSPGQGILEMLPHVAPIRRDPEFSFKVLNLVAKRAIITKTFRDDVSRCAGTVLDFFESICLKK